MQETVVLLHGIWMRPLFLGLLARRLRKAGYDVLIPGYASVTRSPAENAGCLYDLLRHLPAERLHIVAHSLGGIVALHLLEKHPDLPVGRLVTLGSPVRGSFIARTIRPFPLLGLAFGKSLERGLSGKAVPTSIKREWGAVIGTLPIGLGVLFLIGKSPHDGVVQVSEAQHDAQTECIQMPVSHTEMLFSASVFRQVLYFLQTGHFSLP
jgi:pimeloyl-ACP methyl ester carboxylesterase